ncbi:divergent polysaccharide deacetylase family protein [Devosia sp. YIM 151766]|uniref:divergent polysaccharide deacetylase family protein n=1 Tax=Devosia sp. YIM 151766 TaxID=3017325 RepID=UPI00255CD3C9|nr:divergent polysaccharide deacetylase family protein [Devosia sp. YIM 151766]WIY52611.1 divergent polysaccharide deacetylase family protein [Devosia sp. YIM 151766]
MANDLSTPLTGRKRRKKHRAGPFHFPLARLLFLAIVLILGGAALRIALVEDPEGGRPSLDVAITSTRDGNVIANNVASGPATITADPQQFPAGDSPDAAIPPPPLDGAASQARDHSGILPDLSEETANGPIPRMSNAGLTPFLAYRRPVPALAEDAPRIAIIITGLGINEQGSLDAIDALPDDVTLAFAPYGRSLSQTVASARAAGHEVMLEVPMEPFDYPQNDPGPHTILTGETPRANLEKLFWLMARFGGYFGVINNMGARFTASAADMAPILEEFGARGIGYIDDGGSNRSVAAQLAGANKVPFARASLMVDANPARASILAALASLEAQAMDAGSAIGIVSALPISVQTVSEWARELDARGIALVPASALMQ